MTSETEYLHVVTADDISDRRRLLGKSLIWGSAAILALTVVLQAPSDQMGRRTSASPPGGPRFTPIASGPSACAGPGPAGGEQGKRTLFVLPAALFVVSLTVFPLLFGLIIAFSDWNLSSPDGRQFNGLDNLRQMWTDPFYWNALRQHGLVLRWRSWWNMPSPSALPCC